jgi:hypothetical protein
MTSEVSIANRCCTLLGADLIISLADDTNRARAISANYEAIRDAELARHRWRFAIARASLPALATVPDSDYARQFQVPNDFLKLIEGGDLVSGPDLSDYCGGGSLYSREGRTILTNLGAPLHIRYIARITDASMFDPAFAESLAARLADELCERLTQSDSKRQICMAAYKRALGEAKLANALEVPPQSASEDSWIAVRRL